MAKRSKRILPMVGDKSPAAVGERLAFIRETLAKAEHKHNRDAAKMAEASRAEWNRWEQGRELIPKRNAWLLSVRTWNCGRSGYDWPTEWIYAGTIRKYRDIDRLPEFADDLTGFALRVREARERLGITLEDVKLVEDYTVRVNEWRAYEAGIDEPHHLYQLENLAAALEVDAAWLATDTGEEPATKLRLPASLPKWLDPNFSEGGYDVNPGFGQRMKQARENAGLVVSDVARILGMTETNLRKLERSKEGDLGSDPGFALAFAVLTGVSLEWLVYGDDAISKLQRRMNRFRRVISDKRPPRKVQAA